MSKFVDRTGEKFGKLTVLKRVENSKHRHAQFLCRCECGKEVVVSSNSLQTGNTKSCGCLHKEQVKELARNRKGGTGVRQTRLYSIWSNIKQRCYNTKRKDFVRYGGRGITVCDEWRHDFAAFQDWALQAGYDENAPYGVCTIDRIDNDGNYEPSILRTEKICSNLSSGFSAFTGKRRGAYANGRKIVKKLDTLPY